MTERRKIAAILAADVVGFSRMASADEDRTLARLRALRADLIDPIIASQNGRVFKRTGDGALVEFRSVVEAVRYAISVQNAMAERNVGTPEDQRIVFRIGIHLGDVVEEADGDLMGDGVNIAARLEGVAEPGAICLSEQAYWQVKGRLDLAVTDLGATLLKNIAEPVRAYSLQVGVPARARPAPAPASEKSTPPRLSMIVLPFVNLSGGAEQDYFVDGVTESLTTDLSRISGAFVIARNTAFTFKDKSVDVKQVGLELNVRYVLEGSVQRGGSRMRVNVQLIEAEIGAHLWAERFDMPVVDLFDMQDKIVARLAAQLQTEFLEVEARRAEKNPNPNVLDLVFQARAAVNRGSNIENFERSKLLTERALLIDPKDVEALIQNGLANYGLGVPYASDDPAPHFAEAEIRLTRALAIAPNSSAALRVMGALLAVTQRADRGIEMLRHALTLDPNLARAHGSLGLAKAYAGLAEQTEDHVSDALRLSPRDALATNWLLHAGFAKSLLGQDEEALPWLRRSINANRSNHWPYFYSAACLANLGQIEVARRELAAGLALNPKFTIARYCAGQQSANPVFRAQNERIAENLRKAGAPGG